MNDARKFLELHAEKWDTYSKHALVTIHAKIDQKLELLPLTKVMQILRSFLPSETNRIIEQLENHGKEGQSHVSESEFSYLQKLCLVQLIRLITFNARRSKVVKHRRFNRSSGLISASGKGKMILEILKI